MAFCQEFAWHCQGRWPMNSPTVGLRGDWSLFVSTFSGAMTDRKAVIKNADMSEDMQQDAVDCATQAMEKYNIEKDIAAYIKKVSWAYCYFRLLTCIFDALAFSPVLKPRCLVLQEFDKKYNPTWHCIVGRNFGSYVTHETKHFIYFYLGQVAILLFKSGWVQRRPDRRMYLQWRLWCTGGWCHLWILNKTIPWLCWLCTTAWIMSHTTCVHVAVKLLFIRGPSFCYWSLQVFPSTCCKN